ncbi:unnamed protein product [Chrysoparadoxa australica]
MSLPCLEGLGALLGGDTLIEEAITAVIVVCLAGFVMLLCWLWPALASEDKPLRGRSDNRITVASLRVYPIKSCAGHKVSEWSFTAKGLEHDRAWMVMGPEGRFRTQRQLAKMKLVKPSLPAGPGEPITLTASGMPDLTVPVVHEGPRKTVKVWKATCEAIDQGDEAGKWLSKFLEEDGLRLVRMPDDFDRATNSAYGKGVTRFADGFPILLASEESLEETAQRIEAKTGARPANFTFDRFRPNIVVAGGQPFEEDWWTKVLIGGAGMRLVKPCDRCKVPTIDPVTLQAGKEPTETMLEFRTPGALGLDKDKFGASDVFFGQNIIPEVTSGIIKKGDTVTILRVKNSYVSPAVLDGRKKAD